MPKRILITGSTDGIGLETAKTLAQAGHHILLHGRNKAKLSQAQQTVSALAGPDSVEVYPGDLSNIADVEALAGSIADTQSCIDVLINNAGVFTTSDPVTGDGLDVRFAVNTIAPYLLTKRLLPLLGPTSRVVNVSSAAQAPVNPDALTGQVKLDDMAAYSQSKLAITMWSRSLAMSLGKNGPVIVAVNPGSMLGSKMVKQAFSVEGGDLQIGADILTRAAVADEFADASGKYFDNDSGKFAAPHSDALDANKSDQVVQIIESILAELSS